MKRVNTNTNFWELLQSFRQFQDSGSLRSAIFQASENIPKFHMPEIPKTYQSKIDYTSLGIIRESEMPFVESLPIVSKPDGNCLFNSISLLLAGDLSLTYEIKVIFFC